MRDYNFFEIYRKKSSRVRVRSPYFIGAVIIFLCAAAGLVLVAGNLVLSGEIADITAKTAVMQSGEEFAEANRLQQSIELMQRYDSNAESALTSLEAAQVLGTGTLKALFGGIPVSVTLNTLSVDAGSLSITCTLPNRRAAAELILGLRETGLFSDITLTSISTNQDGSGSVAALSGTLKAEAGQ